MSDIFLDYPPPAGAPTHSLRGRQVGTGGTGSVPAMAESIEESTFGVGLVSGQQTVTTSDAALPNVAGRRVHLIAHPINPGIVYLGTAGVSTANGRFLASGQSLALVIANLNLIHVIAGEAGNKVSWLVETVT